MHIGSSRDRAVFQLPGNSNPRYPYTLNGQVTQVSVERDLGVCIDSSLQPSKLCVEAAKRGNRILGMIKIIFCFLKQDIIVVRLYKQLVRRHLEFRDFEIVSRNFEIVSRNFEIISRNFEIMNSRNCYLSSVGHRRNITFNQKFTTNQ